MTIAPILHLAMYLIGVVSGVYCYGEYKSKKTGEKYETMPRRLYVFTRQQYLAGLLEYGTVRLGTLEEYREEDGKSGAKNDVDEGVGFWEPGDCTIEVTPDHPVLGKMLWPPEGTVTFSGGVRGRVWHDYNVFCTVMQLTPLLVRRMSKDFGHDACYRIDVPRDFFIDIQDAVPEFVGKIHVAPVTYVQKRPTSKDIGARDVVVDPYLKPWDYGWQKEFRIIWRTDDRFSVEPRLVSVPSLAKYVTPIDLKPFGI